MKGEVKKQSMFTNQEKLGLNYQELNCLVKATDQRAIWGAKQKRYLVKEGETQAIKA